MWIYLTGMVKFTSLTLCFSDLADFMYTDVGRTLPEDFPFLAQRLANIQERMRNWRPRRIHELFRPGYGDRFAYYTQLFALLIAVVGITGVVLSIVQTAYAGIATNDNSVELAVQDVVTVLQRVEVTLSSLLTVSEEIALAVQALRLNVTG